MIFTLALSLTAAASLAAAQDTTTNDSGLLAYTTSIGPCTTSSIPEDQIVFSIQTDTVVETPGPQSACTFIVNADNPTQIISTVTGSVPTIPTISSSVTEDLITLSGTNSEATSSGTESTVVSTSGGSEMTSTMATTEASAGSASTDAPAASTTSDGAAAKHGVVGAAGIAAVLALL